MFEAFLLEDLAVEEHGKHGIAKEEHGMAKGDHGMAKEEHGMAEGLHPFLERQAGSPSGRSEPPSYCPCKPPVTNR